MNCVFVLLILLAGCSAVPPGVPKIKVPVPDDRHIVDSTFFIGEKQLGEYC